MKQHEERILNIALAGLVPKKGIGGNAAEQAAAADSPPLRSDARLNRTVRRGH